MENTIESLNSTLYAALRSANCIRNTIADRCRALEFALNECADSDEALEIAYRLDEDLAYLDTVNKLFTQLSDTAEAIEIATIDPLL